MKWLIALAAGTFASEDLTCISAGQLIRNGRIGALGELFACFLGIYLGDLALWLAGRCFGRRMLGWRWVVSRVDVDQFNRFANWFDRNSGAAILGSRFVPGSRLPMYLAAGTLGRKTFAFLGWSFIAALIWTPLIVLATAALGDAFARPLHALFGHSWIVLVFVGTFTLAALRLPQMLLREQTRHRLIAAVSRIWRWEFWPMWLFYLPLVPWICWLALRHRSFMLITAANPGIPHGGIVGESKSEILAQLKSPHVLGSVLVRCADDLADTIFPLILKPDAGQRGAGVRIIHSPDEASEYLKEHRGPTLAQAYHAGPFEAGIFYYRFPGQPRGHIFSITDKRFPILIGDSTRTLRKLIWRHPRFRMQAATFFRRHADKLDHILAAGEEFQLAQAGNHCQGTMFCDGAHLITPELEAAIDAVAKTFDGFLFGRFDVRYSDPEAFKSGNDFAIVELNGVTSESTNLYDPNRSIFWAYRTLFQQWDLLFRIASASRSRGARTSTSRELFSEIARFYRDCNTPTLLD